MFKYVFRVRFSINFAADCCEKPLTKDLGRELHPEENNRAFVELRRDPSRRIMSYTRRVQFDETNGEDRTAVRQVAREISARVRRSIEPARSIRFIRKLSV